MGQDLKGPSLSGRLFFRPPYERLGHLGTAIFARFEIAINFSLKMQLKLILTFYEFIMFTKIKYLLFSSQNNIYKYKWKRV
jgi:hypothetical protein